MNEKNTKQLMRSSRTIQDFDRLRKVCLFRRCLFEDPDFPAENSSLYISHFINEESIEWKRPMELVKNPQFFASGSSRFDVCQGGLGDCWLLSTMATLTLHPNLFYQVVPADQDFKENYAGIFHFKFWQCGQWVDIVIDDRLPTILGKKLLYMSSSAKNEFWSALLEKAYAKLRGSYKALVGGCIQEAMEVFTSGISEVYRLKKSPQNLYDILLKSYEMDSLICCGISEENKEAESYKLANNHGYSITKVTYLKTNKGKIPLMRIRNPWGNDTEWTGDWSDISSKWDSVSDFEKKRLGLTVKGDGEFWISFADFKKYFTEVVICHMDKNSLGESYRPVGKKWEMAGLCCEWVKGEPSEDSDLPWNSPQYRITLKHSNEIDGKCSIIISLMQKMSQAQKEIEDSYNLKIGFSICDLRNLEKLPKRLDETFFQSNLPIDSSIICPTSHVTSLRIKLLPGTYCIILFTSYEEGQFLLRVISENKFYLEDCNNSTGIRPFFSTNRKTDLSESESSDEIFRALSKL